MFTRAFSPSSLRRFAVFSFLAAILVVAIVILVPEIGPEATVSQATPSAARIANPRGHERDARTDANAVSRAPARRYALRLESSLSRPGAAPVRFALSGISRVSEAELPEPRPGAVRALSLELLQGHWEPAGAFDESGGVAAPPVVVALDGEGRLVGAWLPAELSAPQRALWLFVAGQLQGSTAAPGLREERDATGSYTAEYASSGAGALLRRKLEYQSVAGAPQGAAKALVTDAETTFALDSGGGLAGLDASERLFFPDLPGLGEVEVHSTLALELTGSDDETHPVAAALVWDDLVPKPAQEIAPRKLGDLPRDLSALAPSERAAWVLGLESHFTANADAARDAAQAVRDLPVDAQDMTVAALAAAGTPAAQAALAQVATDEGVPRDLRHEALAGLGQTTAPEAASTALLAETARGTDRELAHTAAIALGSLGRSDANGDVVTMLLESLAAATSTIERVRWIDALGNTRDPRIVTPLAAILAVNTAPGAPPVERAAAARALRLVPGAEPDAVLGVTLRSDPDPQVRSDAVFAASFRELAPLILALADVVLHDEQPGVRAAAVALLRGSTEPVAQAALAQAARDADPQVRRAARG